MAWGFPYIDRPAKDPHDRILLCDLAGSERLKKSDVGRLEGNRNEWMVSVSTRRKFGDT